MTGRKPMFRRTWIVVALVAVVSLIIGFGVGWTAQLRNFGGTWHRISVASWSPLASDNTALTVVVFGPRGSDVVIRAEVTEQSDTTVRLQGWYLIPPGHSSQTAEGIPMTLRVYLSAPLGGRSVLYPSPNNNPILKTNQ